MYDWKIDESKDGEWGTKVKNRAATTSYSREMLIAVRFVTFDAERAAHTHTHKQRALATHIFHDFTRAQASVHAVVCERLARDELENCTQTLTCLSH